MEFNASTGERLVKDGMNILNVLQHDVTQVSTNAVNKRS